MTPSPHTPMRNLMTALLAMTLSLTASAQWTLNLTQGAKFSITKDGREIFTVKPTIIRPGWVGQGFIVEGEKSVPGKRYVGVNGTGKSNAPIVDLDMSLTQKTQNSVTVHCRFLPRQDTRAHALTISTDSPTGVLGGCRYTLDTGAKGKLPATMGNSPHVLRTQTAGILLNTSYGNVRMDLNPKDTLLIQDNRAWAHNDFVFRYSVPATDHEKVGEIINVYKAKQPYHLELTITLPEKLTVVKAEKIIMRQSETWIPLVNKLDIVKDSALDFTTVIGHHAPAGKYGWTVPRGQHFEFENLPGKPQRFYGPNLCMGAHDLTHKQSDMLAQRLARFGYNTVRFHHHENMMFNFNRQKTIHPNQLDKIFYLFAALKKQGIYITTDVYVSRKIQAADIYPGKTGLISMREFKQLCPVNRRARENWKQFAREFLGTRNPYTGLTLAQDPALNLISMINEGTLTGIPSDCSFPEEFQRQWLQAWNAWIQKKAPTPQQKKAMGITAFPETLLPLGESNTPKAQAYAHFLYDLHQDMYNDMTDFLRNELKCKALFTDMNHSGRRIWAQMTRSTFDYVDDHFYVDHPQFLGTPWRLPSTCSNDSVIKTGQLGGSNSSFIRNLNKPFTITEWNYCGPGRYRGIGGIITGCLAAIQDWGGLWRFTYSHSNNMFNPNSRVAGYFDIVSDPFAQITERATLCLFLRQDLKPADHTVALTVDQQWADNSTANESSILGVPWSGINLIAKVGTIVAPEQQKVAADITVPLTPKAPRGTIHLDRHGAMSVETGAEINALVRQLKWLDDANVTDLKRLVYQTPNRQFTVSAPKHAMILNTDKTAGGFAEAGNTIVTDAATFQIKEADATVWLSSLTEQPIQAASRLLLSHVTELHNTGQTYAEPERKTVLKWGKQPFLVRAGTVQATLNLDRPEQITVYRIDLAGNRIGQVPTRIVNGKLTLVLDIRHQGKAQLLYELVRP